jgi:hypothetical protein
VSLLLTVDKRLTMNLNKWNLLVRAAEFEADKVNKIMV